MVKNTDDIVIIKKYANRRLYDTGRSAYVTLDDLCDLVKQDVNFQVVDAKSGEDLTRSVLTQIIFEQESKGYNILPITFLRRIIKFYDDSLRAVLPSYLETVMENFTKNQDNLRGMMGSFGSMSPFKQFEDLSRQNMELFEKSMDMFTKFNPMDPFGSDEKK